RRRRLGVRVARRRAGAALEGADRRRGGHRDAGDRTARPPRRVREHSRRRHCCRDGAGEAAMRRFIRSAFVIARRDFSATVLSKTFIFFLLAPLFPLVFGGVFGSISTRIASRNERPVIAVAWSKADFDRLAKARDEMSD